MIMETIISWFEIPAKDFKRATKFYETIFDRKLFVMNDEWWYDMAMFSDPKSKEKVVSWAIYSWEKAMPMNGWVVIYLNAMWKLDEILSRIGTAWWKISMEKMDIGEWWHIAKFIDSEGNEIWLHSM